MQIIDFSVHNETFTALVAAFELPKASIDLLGAEENEWLDVQGGFFVKWEHEGMYSTPYITMDYCVASIGNKKVDCSEYVIEHIKDLIQGHLLNGWYMDQEEDVNNYYDGE